MTTSDKIAIPYIVEISAFLLAVVIIVPIFKKLKISPILGYLGIGAAIGPHALGIVDDVVKVQHFAELGVIFLLFTIGLELSFKRLKTYSSLIFGLGSAQILVCSMVIFVIAYFWGNTAQASIILGLCLALSSTAIVVNLLRDSGEFATRYGRSAFAILLMQDLAVVPILILLSTMGGNDDHGLVRTLVISLFRAVIVVGLLILLGRFVLGRLFKMAMQTHSIDVFTATCLLVILLTSIATGLAGLSMALGAFLAGLLLAETEYRHQIEIEIEPFKGLLLGLFFMGVGMNLNMVAAFESGAWVVLSVFGLILMKATIITALCLLFKHRLSDALRTGLLLATAGEFAFVVIAQAVVTYGLIDEKIGQFMVVVATLTMVFAPALSSLGKLLSKKLIQPSDLSELELQDSDDLHDHVIIVGFGRMGSSVANVLSQSSITFVAMDKNPKKITQCHRKGWPVFVGDINRKELFEQAGISRAKALVLTLDDYSMVLKTVERTRKRWPELSIIVRSYDNRHADELMAAGATVVVAETIEASLLLSGHILREMGMARDEANAAVDLCRAEL